MKALWRWILDLGGIFAIEDRPMPAGLRDVCAEVFEGKGFTSQQADFSNMQRDLYAFRRDFDRVVTKSRGERTSEKGYATR